MIAHNKPWIEGEDNAALLEVLESLRISTGEAVAALEEHIGNLFNSGSAVLCSSGTAALFLALKALELRPGSYIAIPTYSCRALCDAVSLAGLVPVVVDVEEDLNISASALARKAKEVSLAAVIVIHNFGKRADLEAIHELRIPFVIEDCCHSFGGKFNSGWHDSTSNICVYSFYATKILTSGQGGMVWCRNRELADRIRLFLHPDFTEGRYVPGFNFRITDFQAAMIGSQLNRIDVIRARRYKIAASYFRSLPVHLQKTISDPANKVMNYRFVMFANSEAERESLYHYFLQRKIECSRLFQKNQLVHINLGLPPHDFKQSENAVGLTLSIPLYPLLSDEEATYIGECIEAMPCGQLMTGH